LLNRSVFEQFFVVQDKITEVILMPL